MAEYREAYRLIGVELEDDPDNPGLLIDQAIGISWPSRLRMSRSRSPSGSLIP